MKKIILISLFAATILSANKITNPLQISFRSIDNGGTLSSLDAYKDGIGVEIVDNPGVATDNSAMNSLVFKYGESAKTANKTIVNQVNGTAGVSNNDLALAASIVNDNTCDDGNLLTTGETWLNGVCQGGISVYVNGTTCSDGNALTVGETWLNGVCQGGTVLNVASNGLLYDNCEGGSRMWAAAETYCASKGMRLPVLGENVGSGGVIVSCYSRTWTSTPYSGNHWFWSGSSVGSGIFVGLVRCVK